MAAKQQAINLAAIEPDILYPADDAAKIRRLNPKTLANERCQRRGPPVTYVGKTPYYRGSDLLADIERGRVDFRKPQVPISPSGKKRRGRAPRQAAT